MWSYERSAHWWDHIALETFTEGDWLDNFRVSQATFLYICDKLKLEISKRDTRFRKAISVKRRVAITLWVLATIVEYCTVGRLFGVAQCTVCSKKHAIVKVLLPFYIKFPIDDALEETLDGFLEQWGIPQCAGSIDGSHIPIRPPAMSHTCYYNRKGWYSAGLPKTRILSE